MPPLTHCFSEEQRLIEQRRLDYNKGRGRHWVDERVAAILQYPAPERSDDWVDSRVARLWASEM